MFKVKTNKSILKVIEREPLASGASKIYGVTFLFDSEWDGLMKTAVFKAGEVSVSVLIEDDYCDVPWEVLARENINEFLWIGIFGADTTGIVLPTIWNQLGIIQPGTELSERAKEETEQLAAVIYETAKGAKEKADQAALLAASAQIYADEAKGYAEQTQTILSEVTNTSDAMLTIHSMTQSEADRAEEAADKAEQAVRLAWKSNDVSNAVKGTLFGTAVAASDVSPVEHDLSVKVRSKNLIPYPYYTGSKTISGITFTVNDDRTVTANGTAEAAATFVFAHKNDGFTLENGKYYTLSGTGASMAYQLSDGTYKYLGANKSILWSSDYTFLHIYYYVSAGTTLDNVIIPAPQFEEGTAATEYMPYVDTTGATVSRCGKNLIPYPHVNTTKTVNGVTFTDNGDGSVTANGTPTSTVYYYIWGNSVMYDGCTAVNKGTYTLTGCPTGGSNENAFRVTLSVYENESSARRVIGDYGSGATVVINGTAPRVCCLIAIDSGTVCNNLVFKPQLEIGDSATEYEPYIEPVTAVADADGNVTGLVSLAPNMSLTSDMDGVVIECEYNRDLMKVIETLTQAIISLGGNI